MNPVFADTFYWYGLTNRRDAWHSLVVQARGRVRNRPIFTTEEVLTEFLGAMSGDPFLRAAASKMVDTIHRAPMITVLPQSHDSFHNGLELYRDRPDKGYSLVDCISMNACSTEGIDEILTNDHHFTQEGFHILITR